MESKRRSRSPPRHPGRHHRDSHPGSPSPRRRRRSSASLSPPRRHRHDSPPRRRRNGPDSPPGRRRRSPSQEHHRRQRSRSRSPRFQRSRRPLPDQEASYQSQRGVQRDDQDGAVVKPPPKEKPNFRPTGILAAETNKVTVGSGASAQNIILKYHEPPEARKPPASEAWVMYIFKEGTKEPETTVPLHSRSCWLMGREVSVADVPLEHPSCSKQHAVFQFRYTTKTNEYSDKTSKVGLYLLDLESSNGTLLNDSKIDVSRYVQCLSGDVVKFADSSREYVVLLPPKG